MLMKSRGFPINIEIKQATLRRFSLPENKRKYIEAEIAKDYAGYNGEKRIDYHLKVFKEPDVRIYNDLRFDDGNPFQIDTLIITPFFILPIDSKNFDGETKIDSIQSIQYDSKGNQKRLTNPISQAKRHSFLMMEWFQTHNFYSIPIESIIVNTNPLGILSADKNNSDIFKKIMNVEMVPQKIEELQKKHTKRFLTSNDLNKIHKFLLNENKPFVLDIEKAYGLDKKQILKGAHCPKCGHLKMVRKNRFWFCPLCGEKSTSAHERAIRDYFLLIKPTITTSECCEFLCIESRYVAKRLLQSMNLPFIGNNKARVYYSPWHKANNLIN